MENSLHEIKEIQWDWDEDDNGDVAEFVVIDGEKYVDVSYFNQKLKEKADRFELHKNTDAKTIQDQSDLIEDLKAKLAEKVQFGKFQSAEELYKAYQNLEREYTKSRQQLAEKDHTINTLIEDHKASQKWYKKQLAEKDEVSHKSSVKEIIKSRDLKCVFRDKTFARIEKCGDVYSPEYGYFDFEDDYDELLNNKKDDRFDIVAIEVIKTTK